jgi:membrane protease YdiL (CAAX protease family)
MAWILYLAAYEFMYRGFFLFIAESYTEMWIAIGLNVVVYAMAHIPKGLKETLGSVPFGLLICYIVLTTGSILVPYVLHVVMALSNEWFSFRAHPDMRLVK